MQGEAYASPFFIFFVTRLATAENAMVIKYRLISKKFERSFFMLKIVAFLLSVLVGASPVATPEAVTVQETMPRVVVDELEDNDMAVLEVSWRDGDICRIADVSWHEFNHEVKEEMELEAINDDIHKVTLKFDYRNRDMEWGTAKDAPVRCVQKLVGYIKED